MSYGAPGAIRTPDPQIRSLVLYPAELRVRGPVRGEGARNKPESADKSKGVILARPEGL